MDMYYKEDFVAVLVNSGSGYVLLRLERLALGVSLNYSYGLSMKSGYTLEAFGSIYVKGTNSVGFFFAASDGSTLNQYFHYYDDSSASVDKKGRTD